MRRTTRRPSIRRRHARCSTTSRTGRTSIASADRNTPTPAPSSSAAGSPPTAASASGAFRRWWRRRSTGRCIRHRASRDAVSDNGIDIYAFYMMVNARSSPAAQKAAWKLVRFYTDHAAQLFAGAGLFVPRKEVTGQRGLQVQPGRAVLPRRAEEGTVLATRGRLRPGARCDAARPRQDAARRVGRSGAAGDERRGERGAEPRTRPGRGAGVK